MDIVGLTVHMQPYFWTCPPLRASWSAREGPDVVAPSGKGSPSSVGKTKKEKECLIFNIRVGSSTTLIT